MVLKKLKLMQQNQILLCKMNVRKTKASFGHIVWHPAW